jgi:hypothetical protein
MGWVPQHKKQEGAMSKTKTKTKSKTATSEANTVRVGMVVHNQGGVMGKNSKSTFVYHPLALKLKLPTTAADLEALDNQLEAIGMRIGSLEIDEELLSKEFDAWKDYQEKLQALREALLKVKETKEFLSEFGVDMERRVVY